MDKINKKYYFNFPFLIFFCIIAVLGFIGMIVFILFGIFKGIADWEIEGVLIFGFVVFGSFVLLCVLLVLVGGLYYWRIDDDGIVNGRAFWKIKINFDSADSYSIDRGYLPSIGCSGVYTTECFHLIKGKKKVIVPLYCLTQRDIEWLESKVTKLKDKKNEIEKTNNYR